MVKRSLIFFNTKDYKLKGYNDYNTFKEEYKSTTGGKRRRKSKSKKSRKSKKTRRTRRRRRHTRKH